MARLDRFWTSVPGASPIPLNVLRELPNTRRIDIAGVASSILATPTIENPVKPTVLRGFCCDKRLRVAASQLGVDANVDQ